jgi:hypothetical protein
MVYLLTGGVAGFIAGLFGVGGGLIIVPALMLVFAHQGFDPSYTVHLAVGTSLMTIVMTSLSSMWAHHQQQTTDWPLVFKLTPMLLIGSALGAMLAVSLSSLFLQVFIGVFAWMMAVKLWLPLPTTRSVRLLSLLPLSLYGGLAGVVSAMIGIGGGSLIVPYLVTAGVNIKQAVGTSASCGFPIALSGAMGFMVFGTTSEEQTTTWQTGFVHWQAFIGIVLLSVLMAPVGAKWAKKCPQAVLQRAFSALLLIVGSVLILPIIL